MKTVVVVAMDGMMDSSLAITLDTLRTANTFAARAKGKGLRVVVAAHRKRVRTGGGMVLEAGVTFADLRNARDRADWLVFPGLGMTSEREIEERLVRKDAAEAIELVRDAAASRRIGASCSSVFLLAKAGVLEGRAVTTTWWLANAFRTRHPEVRLDEGQMLVRDGRFTTAGSAFAQLDLALAIVTDTLGAAIAQLCARYLLIDRRPSQARYMIRSHARHVDPTIVAMERLIDENLAQPLTVSDLAKVLAMSQRTLARRVAAATGVSPVRYLQRRRVLHAADLIETTSMSIDEVAAQVGYQDGTTLRKLMKREFGVTPAALRS